MKYNKKLANFGRAGEQIRKQKNQKLEQGQNNRYLDGVYLTKLKQIERLWKRLSQPLKYALAEFRGSTDWQGNREFSNYVSSSKFMNSDNLNWDATTVANGPESSGKTPKDKCQNTIGVMATTIA